MVALESKGPIEIKPSNTFKSYRQGLNLLIPAEDRRFCWRTRWHHLEAPRLRSSEKIAKKAENKIEWFHDIISIPKLHPTVGLLTVVK
jgi:hypothetical protein